VARTVPGDRPGLIKTIVPKAFDNHLDADPVEVDLRVPTEADKRSARSSKPVAFEIDTKTGAPVMDGQGRVKVEFDGGATKGPNRRAFERGVFAVRNYTGADGKAIDTGARLLEHGEAAFVTEIAVALEQLWELTEVEKKTSSAPSVSSSAATPASTGIAGSAAPKDSPSNAAAE